MASYDVYGVGNALVDKEFEVDDAFFASNNIQKGMMTLVEKDNQQQILDVLTREFGIKKRAGGGSAANTLYALSQFGGNAYFSCKVANDETGDSTCNNWVTTISSPTNAVSAMMARQVAASS